MGTWTAGRHTSVRVATALVALAVAGPAWGQGLQARVDATPGGGTLRLAGEALGSAVVRKSLTIVGAGPETRMSLSVEGGRVRLEGLTLVAPAGGYALRQAKGSKVTLQTVTVACSPGATGGVRVAGSLEAQATTVEPGCPRGFDVQEGSLSLVGGVVRGKTAAIRLVDGRLVAQGSRIEAGGVGLFSARSKIELDDVTLAGGEQGLLSRAGSLASRGLRVEGSSESGVALVETTAGLDQSSFVGPFFHAALFASESPDVEVRGLTVERAGAGGVLSVRSTLRLAELSIGGARSDGDGDFGHAVSLEESRAQVSGLFVTEVSGAGLYASNSTAAVNGLQVRRSGAGVASTWRAKVRVRGLSVDEASQVGVAAWQEASVALAQSQIAAHVGLVACHGGVVERGEGVLLAGSATVECDGERFREGGWQQVVSDR